MTHRKVALEGAAVVLAAAGTGTAAARPASASSADRSAKACEFVINYAPGSNDIISMQANT